MKTKYYLKAHGSAANRSLTTFLNLHHIRWVRRENVRCYDGVIRTLREIDLKSFVVVLAKSTIKLMPFLEQDGTVVKFTVAQYADIAMDKIFNDPVARRALIYRVFLNNDFSHLLEELREFGEKELRHAKHDMERS